jgi:multimeric flavodoxin WrbA
MMANMKLVCINGSPRGRQSATFALASAFLRGAERAGALTEQLLLAERRVAPCRGCYSCWKDPQGRCAVEDDLPSVLSACEGADALILATPLYFSLMSGTLKDFIDRLTSSGSPHAAKRAEPRKPPRIAMIANCGYPDRGQFEILSRWAKRFAAMMGSGLACEIYAPRGKLFAVPPEAMLPDERDYLGAVERAGAEIAAAGSLSEKTAGELDGR